ncbi:MAG: endonuclease/exonuclease/phosphatase family protein, partial [Candidatus Taylorbacteria bacterium]|nr:endonuclease/exonuclease/phosphatase family protein [Candidatus Taylorbacteria bacterium]
MIRFASINIEGDSHLERVISFLGEYKPDVVCFQELVESRVSFFEQTLGMKGHFMPTAKHNVMPFNPESPIGTFGVALFSKYPVSDVSMEYYFREEGEVPQFIRGQADKTIWRALVRGTVIKDGEPYVIAVTHFTWTSDGSTSDKQRVDLKHLLALTEKDPELILCGDFNAPRGGEIFSILSGIYKDNIPPEYVSSLDTELH